jgi:dihydrofolate synthase/folylpolyglutamate synthase
MVNDKDISGMLKLLPVNAIYYYTQAQVKRALSAKVLREKAYNYNLSGTSFGSVKDAVNEAILEASADDLILITGSNFVVGEALSLFPAN